MPLSADPVSEIRATLRGPVMRVLTGLMPELEGVEAGRGYEMVMDDVALLERAFAAFRDNRDRFAALLVDTTGRPVGADDDMPLSCGRSLNQVVAMVVRSAARRYFRRRLPALVAGARRAAAQERRGVVADLMTAFHGPQTPPTAPRPLMEGEVLYREISDYLHYDWQARLVPSYSKLSVTQVRRLGEMLLQIRDEKMLAAALAGKPMPEPETVAPAEARVEEPAKPAFDPAAMSEQELFLARLIDETGQVRITLLAEALGGAHARAALSAGSTLRRNAVIPPDVGAGAVTVMVKIMDLRAEQIAVALISAYAMLGRDGFASVFGATAKPTTMRQLVERARAAGIGRYSSPSVVADFMERSFAKAREKLFAA